MNYFLLILWVSIVLVSAQTDCDAKEEAASTIRLAKAALAFGGYIVGFLHHMSGLHPCASTSGRGSPETEALEV